MENGFDDMEGIKELNVQIMTQIGIDKIGHRMKLMRHIATLNKRDIAQPQYNEGGTAFI